MPDLTPDEVLREVAEANVSTRLLVDYQNEVLHIRHPDLAAQLLAAREALRGMVQARKDVFARGLRAGAVGAVGGGPSKTSAEWRAVTAARACLPEHQEPVS